MSKKLFYVLLSALYVWIWFGIVHNLAVDMLFDMSSIDQFIHRLFPTERKVVPWHSCTVALLVLRCHYMSSNPTIAVVNTFSGGIPKINIKVKETLKPIHMAGETFSQPHTGCWVTVTTSSSGIHTVEPRILE